MAEVVINAADADQAIAWIVAKQVEVFGLTAWPVPAISSSAGAAGVREEIDTSAAVLTLWSPVSTQSARVVELAQVADSQQKLLNAKLGACELPVALATQAAIDLSEWVQSRSPLACEDLRIVLMEIVEDSRQRAETARVEVYVGYTSLDRERALPIVKVLQDAGYATWWDLDLVPGQDWRNEIRRSFDEAKCVVALLSKRAVQSQWLRHYWHAAAIKRTLLPVLIEPIDMAEMPEPMSSVNACDLSGWQGATGDPRIAELLKHVAALVGPPRPKSFTARPRRGTDGSLARPRSGYDVFVSYKKEDRPKVDPFVERIKTSNLSMWWDQMIPDGANWGFSIDQALLASRAVVVFWTPLSVKSEEVYSEADHGMRMSSLFPVLLEPCVVSPRMQRIQWVDLTAPAIDYMHAFGRLLGSIKQRIRAA